MIERYTPDIGYGNPGTAGFMNLSQAVKANGFIHYSGIIAMGADGACVAPNDPRGQIERIFHILEKLLEVENLTMGNVVATTIYTTDMQALRSNTALIAKYFGECRPTSTWVEVNGLAAPEYIVEIVPVVAV